jgi:hypothetical protein
LADPRHQRRQKATEILRDAINDDRSDSIEETVRRYETAVTQAVDVIGSTCRAATSLKQALLQAKGSRPISDAELNALRDRVEQICETLVFAPMMEAEMPIGFPAPTPVGEIEVKQYPAYRMAKTDSGEASGFWTLFSHIKRNKIAMTTPVEMSYQAIAVEPTQRSMAFLYGQPSLGETGSEGSVEVLDVPPQTVISVGLRGARTQQKVVAAQRQLTNWLKVNATSYRPAGQLRVMGYNSPFVATSRQYFEVQLPINRQPAQATEDDLPRDFELSN